MAHAQRLVLTHLAALLVACGQTHAGRDAGEDAGSIDAGRADVGVDSGPRDGGIDGGSDAGGPDASPPDAGPPCTGMYAPAGSPLDLTGIDPVNNSIIETARGYAWIVESDGTYDLYEVGAGFGGLMGPRRVDALPITLDGDELPVGGVARGPHNAGVDRWLVLLGRPHFTGAFYAVTIDTSGRLRGGPWVLWPGGMEVSVVAHGVGPAGFELLWYEDASATPSCPISRLTVMHVALDGTTSLEAPVELEGVPQVHWREDRFFVRSFRGCAPEIVETVAQIDTSGVLVGPREVSGLPVTAGHRWRLPQEGPWIALGSYPTDMAVTTSVTATFVDPVTGGALGPPFEVWNRGASHLLLEYWGRAARLPDGSYGWRFSAGEPASPLAREDLFVRFDESRVLQTIVLGRFRRGYAIRQLGVHLDGSVTTTWIESTGRVVGDELVCGE
ncbi:MAG TPA: hypothetical protein RMH99_10395 [Sandaracinaceae bacterium LLY-WYZ-13_1]|nr:hypothetical protein [Sandaracinaceae bacterium LLY-WYZ-13_1]